MEENSRRFSKSSNDLFFDKLNTVRIDKSELTLPIHSLMDAIAEFINPRDLLTVAQTCASMRNVASIARSCEIIREGFCGGSALDYLDEYVNCGVVVSKAEPSYVVFDDIIARIGIHAIHQGMPRIADYLIALNFTAVVTERPALNSTAVVTERPALNAGAKVSANDLDRARDSVRQMIIHKCIVGSDGIFDKYGYGFPLRTRAPKSWTDPFDIACKIIAIGHAKPEHFKFVSRIVGEQLIDGKTFAMLEMYVAFYDCSQKYTRMRDWIECFLKNDIDGAMRVFAFSRDSTELMFCAIEAYDFIRSTSTQSSLMCSDQALILLAYGSQMHRIVTQFSYDSKEIRQCMKMARELRDKMSDIHSAGAKSVPDIHNAGAKSVPDIHSAGAKSVPDIHSAGAKSLPYGIYSGDYLPAIFIGAAANPDERVFRAAFECIERGVARKSYKLYWTYHDGFENLARTISRLRSIGDTAGPRIEFDQGDTGILVQMRNLNTREALACAELVLPLISQEKINLLHIAELIGIFGTPMACVIARTVIIRGS